MKTLLAAAALVAVASTAFAEPGTVTISVDEYEDLKKAAAADESGQLWHMTWEQILEREKGDVEDAWELYEYYVLRRLPLEGMVNGASVDPIIEDLRILNEIDAKKPITLVLSSGGGSVFDGLRLYNAMMSLPAPVNTECDGMAMSMAAILLAAGDHRTASPGCMFMVHEVGGGARNGQTSQQIKTADVYLSLENELLRILSENSGLSIADVRRVGEWETWYTGAEAMALGFVDELIGGKPRRIPPGTRAVPDGLDPRNRIARQVADRMAE